MNRKQKRKPLEQMDVMDDFMMNELASHPTEGEKFGRTMISVLLQRKIGKITIKAQSVFQGDTPELRGIRLDVEIREQLDEEKGEGERKEKVHLVVFMMWSHKTGRYRVYRSAVVSIRPSWTVKGLRAVRKTGTCCLTYMSL